MKRLCWITFLLLGCATSEEAKKAIDIQGHRGARGLMPENSIPAFLLAAELGVTTMELDLVVSQDGDLVLSHEPFFSADFCLDSIGGAIAEENVLNMYRMGYAEIRAFDCGSKGNAKFPQQRKMVTSKPLLSQVIDTIESFRKDHFFYNIELKTEKETDTIFHPTPAVFSDMVYEFISERGMWDRVNIQSFDFRTLQYFNKKYPEVRLALLIENELPWQENLDSLGFNPEIYSCYYPLLNKENISLMQAKGILVIPWTVNEQNEMNKLIDWGVDGIITDYPDRALSL